MPSFSKVIVSAFIAFNLALPALAQGTQFITGACKSDAECAGGCCGFKTGKCAGAIVALERDNGCGFGNPQSNNNAALALGFTGDFTPTTAPGGAAASEDDAPAAEEVDAAPAAPAVAPGTQFITGACKSDADCAGGCCGFKTGKCAGAIVALERDNGCGFGNPQSNNNAAVALGFTGAFTPSSAPGSRRDATRQNAALKFPRGIRGWNL